MNNYNATLIMTEYPGPVCDARETREDWSQFSEWHSTSAAEAWIIDNGGLIMSIAQKYANWQYSAEDLFQELAMHLFSNFDSYDKNWVETKDTTYFYTIMERRVFEIYRRGNAQSRNAYKCGSLEFITEAMKYNAAQEEEKEEELSISDVLGSLQVTEGIEDSVLERLFCQEVLEEINKMKDTRKKIFLLYLQGYTQMEIAAIVGCVQSAVSYHINQAQEALRKHFKEVA